MGRTVVVGDIHGCFEELLALCDAVDLRAEDLLVSVGDLVDRGPAPGEVVRFFRERPNSVVVMGNHERKHVRGVFSYAQEITRLQLGDGYAEAVEWMRTLPYFFENEHVRVVHAALVPGLPLDAQREEILCGSTSGERALATLLDPAGGHWHEHYTDPKPVAFGHHVTGREPLLRDGRVFGLDTGACHGWNLTAVRLPGGTVHAVPARADHWADSRRRWQLPVLRTRPWRDYTWAVLAESADRFEGDWLDQVRAWSATLQAAQPALLAAAADLAATLPAAELPGHPAAQVLFQARAGRLDAAALARRCTTPRRTMELAAALGVPVPDLPQSSTP
jgi:serine/threonine protein phosphatase 1